MSIFDLYHSVRDQIRTGDLIEWHTTGSPVSSLIRLKTGQDFNHSSLAIVLPDVYRVGYRDKVIVVEAIHGGVKSSYLSNVIEHHKGYAVWYKLKDNIVSDLQRLKIGRWAFHEELAHKGYDYKSLFKELFVRVNSNAAKYFCSEFYQIALEQVGLIRANSPALSPGEFETLMLHEKGVRIQ